MTQQLYDASEKARDGLIENFERAMTEHGELVADLRRAQAECDAFPASVQAGGGSAADRARYEIARDAVSRIRAALPGQAREIWGRFFRWADSSRETLAQIVEELSVLDPDAVDAHAMLILESGTMKARDFEKMTRSFVDAGNGTMVRLARPFAEAYRDQEDLPPDERRAMATICETLTRYGDGPLAAIDAAIAAARQFVRWWPERDDFTHEGDGLDVPPAGGYYAETVRQAFAPVLAAG